NSSRLSRMSFSGEDGRAAQARPAPGAGGDRPMVTFARRTHSGRYVSYSRDDLDSELANSDYHVHIPVTPDNQPMDPAISARVEEQYVSNSLFTGGFNSVTRAHLMDKVIDSEASHPQMAGSKGSSCAVNGCDGKVMSDERGQDILPCECDFKICAECFGDAVKNAGALCPGCKEPYKATEMEDLVGGGADGGARPTLSLPPPPGGAPASRMERRLSIVRSQKAMTRSQTGDWDHNRWLFETKGTYGYGNAIWPKENDADNGNGGSGGGLGGTDGQPAEFTSKPWRPLTRKLKIPAGILSPYRRLDSAMSIMMMSCSLTWFP
uniref:Cellulose synthase RING-type zinc finger domain-containing protein n=1 Tax=Aegilops tauschii subsp. strangulata TaxID=200361 RepID=A0A453QDX3_AEGTS